uniref:Uncharacterized protein n=1 Tax=Caenorhabditis japonica TaxID=281687 RepID=A0A8R1IED4_CAEJA
MTISLSGVTSEEMRQVKRDDASFKKALELKRNIEDLTGVLTFILFHNELQSGSVSLKYVIENEWPTQNMSGFVAINESPTWNTTRVVEVYDWIRADSLRSYILNPIEYSNNQIKLPDSLSLTDAQIDQMFESFANNGIEDRFEYSKSVSRAAKLLDPFWEYSGNSTLAMNKTLVLKIYNGMDSYIRHCSEVLNEMKELGKDMVVFNQNLDTLSSFSADYEQFKKLQNFVWLPILKEAFGRLKSTKQHLDILSKYVGENGTNLVVVKSFLNMTISNSSQILISFPNGSGISTIFENEWLKMVLNNGESLLTLKEALLPLLEFFESILNPGAGFRHIQHTYFNGVPKILKTIEMIDFQSVLRSFSEAEANLVQQESITSFFDWGIEQLSESLPNSADFVSFTSELRELLNSKAYAQFDISEWKTFYKDIDEITDEQKFEKVMSSQLFLDYKDLLTSLRRLIEPLESKKTEMSNFLLKISALNSTVPAIKRIVKVAQIMISIKKAMEHFIETLRYFPSLEKYGFEAIGNFLRVTKSKIEESEKLEDSLKRKVNVSEHFDRLNTTSISRELITMLDYSQRAIGVYIEHDVHKIIHTFEANIEALNDKVNSLPDSQRHLVPSTWSYFTTDRPKSDSYLSTLKMWETQISSPNNSLYKFGDILSFPSIGYWPSFDNNYATSILESMNASTIGESKEFLDAKMSLQQLQEIHLLITSQQESISPLLNKTEDFFKQFFEKPPEEKSFW